MPKMINHPEFGEIVDFDHIRDVLVDVNSQLVPEFNMLGGIKLGSDRFNEEPNYLIAAGASMLAWMMLLAADETEIAEELKGKLFTLGWTEEKIGSDLLSMSTQATPMSDDPNEREYHIKGHKWLINNSYHGDYHMVIAKIDPEQDGPRSMSVFLVPRSSCKNWEKLDTHVLRNMVLTTYEIDGPGRLIGKKGHGLSIVQRMAAAARYQCAFVGMRMCQNSMAATLDHLSTKTIFKNQPIKFSNVFRQLYNLVLQAAFLNFMYNRAVVFSDTSFLTFHGTMLKSFLLLRGNELLSQNWLVAGSKGFLKESIIGRDAIDSFVLPVFDGHYTINTLMTAKHMSRYLNAERTANADERINQIRENLFDYVVGNQLNKKPREIRNPEFFNYANYWNQLHVPLDIDADEMVNNVRTLMAEIDNAEHPYKLDTRLSSEAEYKYKTGTLVHWLESILAAAEFWKVMNSNDYLNIIVQQYNAFVKAYNDIISEGALQTPFLTPIHHLPLPDVDDNEAYLRNLLDIQTKIAAMRAPVAGD